MSDDRKVIPFKKSFKKSVTRTTPNDMRAAATGTLAMILLMMVGFNFQMFGSSSAPEPQSRGQRGIASVPKVLEPQWKKSLSELGKNEVVIEGHRPSAVDNLTYGYLKGNYSFTVEKGVVKNVQFSHSSDATPQTVSNRQKFLADYGNAIVQNLEGVLSSKREAIDGGFREIYSVKAAGATKTVEFHLNSQNGLLGISVQ